MLQQAQIIEQNLNQYYYYLAEKNKLHCVQKPQFSFIHESSLGFLNKIFALTKSENICCISELTECIDAGNCPQYVMFNDRMVDSGFENELINCHYKFFTQWPGMLLNIEKPFNHKHSKDIEINVVHNPKELNHWLQIIETGLFNNKEKLDFGFFEKLLNESLISFHLLYYQEIPASAIMSFNDGDTCGLYLLATLSEYRRMGFADAIMKAAINHGFDQGMKYSILQASDAGYKIYQKMGFEEYCKIKVYHLK